MKRAYLPQHLRFRQATVDDYPFLYRLLVERYEKETPNISGLAKETLPTYEEHVDHLEGSPYKRLEIICVDETDAGMTYLTHSSVVGCFVLRSYGGRGVALSATYKLLLDNQETVFAHTNPKNRPACRNLDRLGFEKTETLPDKLSYQLNGPPNYPFRRVERVMRNPSRHNE